MNPDHAALCSSEQWAEHIRDEVLPRTVGEHSLGQHVLEIGPGYGAATRWLLPMVDHLTAIETDPELANDLEVAFPTVTVVHGSGARVPFDDRALDAVVCFTMLHHVPSDAEQDAIFAEASRVLRPGGVFVGSDSLGSQGLAEFHYDDTYVPIDPDTLPARLRAADHSDVDVQVFRGEAMLVTFSARRSGPP